MSEAAQVNEVPSSAQRQKEYADSYRAQRRAANNGPLMAVMRERLDRLAKSPTTER